MNTYRFSFSRFRVSLAAILLISSLAVLHLWQERYYFRFLPIPHSAMEVLYQKGGILPTATPHKPKGTWTTPKFDLTTDKGLREALNYIQTQSPISRKDRKTMNYEGVTFDSWIAQTKTTPFLCTDASMLFMLMAWQQGLIAREWWLLTKTWRPGQGHSMVEFFNPRNDTWVLVDPQHAGIVRNKSGHYLDMKDVIGHFVENTRDRALVDYGPYRESINKGVRGPTTEEYFYTKDAGLSVPVLNLRPPLWFATPRQNDLIIGYPILVSGLVHDARIYTTKLAALFILIMSGFTLILAIRRLIINRRE